MGIAEMKAALIKKGYSKVSLDKKVFKEEIEPKSTKSTKPKKEKLPIPDQPPKNEPEVEIKEHECNNCGESPKDCDCADCDC